METSIFIARIFGLCYLILGACFLFNRKAFQGVMEDFCKNRALVFFGGFFALVIGVLIILTHNTWVANWTVIITIIGWIGLVKGIWMIAFPDTVSTFVQAYQRNESLPIIHSIAALILGALLTFFGFFAG